MYTLILLFDIFIHKFCKTLLMSLFQRVITSSKLKFVIPFFILIGVTIIFLIGFNSIESTNSLKYVSLLLLVIVIILLFAIQYLLKVKRESNSELSKLLGAIKSLETKLKEANDFSDHQAIYLANMSHEIRTPLSTIIGMLNMLDQADLDEDQKVQVEIAEYSSRHLLQLVNMILDNSEVSSEEVKLNCKPVNLESDLTKLFRVFEYQAWDKGLEYEYKFLSEIKKNFSLMADSTRIQQVLINLINNAIKFTNAGKISIIVDQTVGIDGDQIISFYVKDTGIGMRPFEVRNIFENSKKLESPTSKDYRGRGIGLSISHQLVKLMGGELKIESKENEGTTFYFSLQLKKTLNVQLESVVVKPILLNKLNALVAEDNIMNQKGIKFLLEQQGVDCTFAKNGVEAVELFKILDFDMVFMDIYMPDLDGYQATEKIKKSEKYTQNNIPIIAVSASAFKDDITKAKQAGIDDFLAKPIEVLKLKELLSKYNAVKKEVD